MSYPVRVRIDPTFGHDIARIRGRTGTTTNPDGTHIFSLKTPLTLASDPVTIDSQDTPHIVFSAEPSQAGSKSAAASVSSTTQQLLHERGQVATSVDSLSRTVVQQSAAVDTLLARLQDHGAVSHRDLTRIKETLSISHPEVFCESEYAHDDTDTVASMITSHEQQHLTDLIFPDTAFWKELELFWVLQQLLAASEIIKSPDILNRFAVLYALPRQTIAELNAIAAERTSEDFESLDPEIESQLTADRGIEQRVWEYFLDQGLEHDSITEIISHPVAQQFGDIWLVYVVRQLQMGNSIAAISGSDFLDQIGVDRPDELLGMDLAPELRITDIRDSFTEFVMTQLYGPAYELIELETTPDSEFVLIRSWYNTNRTTGGPSHRLAVRRAIFVRHFLSIFRTRTKLREPREKIASAVVAGINGASVSLSAPILNIDTDRVATTIRSSYKAVLDSLNGISSRDQLARWLNNPNHDPLSQL